LSIDAYEAVRCDSTQFLVLPDHFTPEVEEVVRRTDSYWRKFGAAGEYVEHLDPRDRSSADSAPDAALTQPRRHVRVSRSCL
jgi:hypothetical protein